jgi:hypothetical protein
MGDTYEIRLAGRLSEAVASSFDGMSATERPAETILLGTVEDQACLYGLLDRVGELGLTLLEVRRLSDNASDATDRSGPSTGPN